MDWWWRLLKFCSVTLICTPVMAQLESQQCRKSYWLRATHFLSIYTENEALPVFLTLQQRTWATSSYDVLLHLWHGQNFSRILYITRIGTFGSDWQNLNWTLLLPKSVRFVKQPFCTSLKTTYSKVFFKKRVTQQTITCSKSTIETLVKDVKYAQSWQLKQQNEVSLFECFYC